MFVGVCRKGRGENGRARASWWTPRSASSTSWGCSAWTRSGSILAPLHCCLCVLFGQADVPVLSGIDRDLLGGRQPRTRRVVSSSPHFDALLAAPLWIAPVQFRYSTTADSACYLHWQTHRYCSASIATVLMSGEHGEGELRARACILARFWQHGVAGLCGDPGLGQQWEVLHHGVKWVY